MGMTMLRLMKALKACRRGATAVEYGLIVSLIVIAMIASLKTFANTTTTMWNTVQTKISAAG